jgi:murein DD-endopeptidase MepM/ murein hydrolase activator NlpD
LAASATVAAPALAATYGVSHTNQVRLRALLTRLRDLDFVCDLAEDIGTPRWWRGVMSLIGLVLGAWLLLPGIAPLSAAVPVSIDHAADDGFRSSALRPLSYGTAPQRLAGVSALLIPLAAAPERPRLDLVATLGSQDSFSRMLQRAGVSADDTARAAALVDKAVPLGQLAPGTHVSITLGQRGDASAPRPLEALSLRARFDLDLAVERRGSALTLGQRPIAIDATPLRIRGIVGSSLYRSARAAGAPPAAIQDYLRALDEHSALDGIDPTDEFDFVLSYRRSTSGESLPGELLYAGLDRDGKARTQLVRWGNDGHLVDALTDVTASAAQQEETVGLGAPVSGHVTSGFGLRRHPILGYVRMHAGIDFAASFGSPIYAVSDGQVSYAGWHGGHGNYVRLEHGGGLATGYGHMSRIAVSPGLRVGRGQVIGYVGSTGLSTGPHLHYELLRDGHPINPGTARFMMSKPQVNTAQLSAELNAIRAKLAQLLAIEPGAALVPLGGHRAGATR